MSFYPCEYAESLNARRFQAIPFRVDSRTVYDARHGVNQDMQVNPCFKRWTRSGGRRAVLRHDSAPWLDIPFSRCTEERGYKFRVPEIVAQYVHVSSNNLPAASLDSVAFGKTFERMHIYGNFSYWVKEAISESRLRACGDGCCFIYRYFVDSYAVFLFVHLRLSVLVADWWRSYDFSRIFYVRTLIVVAYYSNLLVGRRALQQCFRIGISEFCVWDLVSFLLSAIVSGTVDISSGFSAVKDIVSRVVFFLLPKCVQIFLQSTRPFRIISHCTISSAKDFFG